MMLNLETRPQMLRLLFRTFTVDLGLRLALLALGVGRVGMHCDYSKTFISFCDSITVVVVELVYNLMIGDSVTIISWFRHVNIKIVKEMQNHSWRKTDVILYLKNVINHG